MFFLLIQLIVFSLYHFCFGADVAVFYTKHDQDNIVLHYIRENYVTSFKVVVEREKYCPNFEDITIIGNNVCTFPVIFYPFLNKTTNEENYCSFLNHINRSNIKTNYLENYMEVKHSNNTWVISATKKDKKFTLIVIETVSNFYYNIQTAVKKVMDFVEEEHFHECKTKKKVKRFAFISQLSNDFIIISRLYFICIMVLLLGSLSIGIYLLIRNLISRTVELKNESAK